MKPKGICPFPQKEGFTVKTGERHDLVTVIQLMLCELKVWYDCFGEVTPAGIYDGATEEAVRAYQKAAGLDETGCVDVVTWNRLAEEYNAAVYEDQ